VQHTATYFGMAGLAGGTAVADDVDRRRIVRVVWQTRVDI